MTQEPSADEDAPAAPCAAEPRWSEPILEYVRMVTSLIEGRAVRRAEIILMLERVFRQRRLGKQRRMDYVIDCLNHGPSG